MQETAAGQLVRALDHEIRSRGHGSIRGIDRAVGRGEGWWQRRVEAGDLSFHQLLIVLDHLGLNPVRFFRKTMEDQSGLELDRPRGEPPEIVRRARNRLRAGGERKGIGETYLDTLDQQRYEEPREVIKLTLWTVDHVELALLPQLLGVAGSAWRLLICLDEAEHAIHAGIEIAQGRDDQRAVGELLQRLSYVVADRGEHAEALRITEKAAMMYLQRGDRVGLGKALVDQGIWLSRLDRPGEAIATLKSAVEWLPDRERRNRCTALQVIALNYRQLGELENALSYVTDAEKAASGLEQWAKGKMTWLKSKIHADLGQLDQAAAHLWEVVEIFRQLHTGEAALATCDLVRVQLRQGLDVAAYQTATSMRALLEPLRHNKIISAAIGDLLRCGETGLTLALVDRSRNQIESERKRRKLWQSLRITRL